MRVWIPLLIINFQFNYIYTLVFQQYYIQHHNIEKVQLSKMDILHTLSEQPNYVRCRICSSRKKIQKRTKTVCLQCPTKPGLCSPECLNIHHFRASAWSTQKARWFKGRWESQRHPLSHGKTTHRKEKQTKG